MQIVDNKIFNSNNFDELKSLEIRRFEDCKFEQIKFSDIAWRFDSILDCEFVHCSFVGVDFRNISLRNISFTHCNLMGVNWSITSRFDSCNFYSCKLDYSIFQGLKIRGFKFIDCVMKEADFSASQLVGSDFSGALLDGTSFDRADLSKTDFRTAKNYQINPLSSKIIGAKFSFPEAMSLVSALGAEINY